MDTKNDKPKTILETLIQMNNSVATNTKMSYSTNYVTYCPGIDISLNRHRTKTDKWAKYVDLMQGAILQSMPSMCLVKKDNVSKTYQGADGSSVYVEYRFKGDPSRQYCQVSICDGDNLVYRKAKETPKKVYKRLCNFMEEYYEDCPDSSLFK